MLLTILWRSEYFILQKGLKFPFYWYFKDVCLLSLFESILFVINEIFYLLHGKAICWIPFSAFSIDFVCLLMFITYVPGKDVKTLKGKNVGMQKIFCLQVDLRSPLQRGFYITKENASRITIENSRLNFKTQILSKFKICQNQNLFLTWVCWFLVCLFCWILNKKFVVDT